MSYLSYSYPKPIDLLFNKSHFSQRLMRRIIRNLGCKSYTEFTPYGSLRLTVVDKNKRVLYHKLYSAYSKKPFSLELYDVRMMKEIIIESKCKFYAKLTPINTVELTAVDTDNKLIYRSELDLLTLSKNFYNSK